MRINFNCYKVLNVPNFSIFDVVKDAYRKLALVHHPDRGGNEETMKLLNAAYDVLKKQKNKYDAWLQLVLQPRIPSFTIIIKGWEQNYANNWATSDNSTGTTSNRFF